MKVPNQRLIHDVSFSGATDALEVVGLCLPPEHQKDIFDEFYAIFKANIEAYETQRDRMEHRLAPSKN